MQIADWIHLQANEEEQGHEQAKASKKMRSGVPVQLMQQAPAHPGVSHWQHNQAVQVEHTAGCAPAPAQQGRLGKVR